MNKFIPSAATVGQQIVITLLSMVVITWLVSKSPALKNLVDPNN